MTVHTKESLKLVEFTSNDIPGLIALSASVGWDYEYEEISTVLGSGKIFGHKNSEGVIVSSAAIIPYDDRLASIGMVIVHGDFRGMGLGKKATQKCIDKVRSMNASIMLIATPDGKPLYEKMGFKEVDCVHKFLCEKFVPITTGLHQTAYTIEEYQSSDLPALLNLDKDAFGDKRSKFLLARIQQAKTCLVVKDSNKQVLAFGMAIAGPIHLILGPIVAPDNQIAVSLLEKLVDGHDGALRIDVPSDHGTFMTSLEQSGFHKVSQPPIMIYPSSGMPARNRTYFGIAAQVFG